MFLFKKKKDKLIKEIRLPESDQAVEELLNVKKKVDTRNAKLKFGTKDNPYNFIAGTEFYAVLVEAGIADSNKKVDLVCIKDCWFKIVSTEFVDKEKAYIPNYATWETIEMFLYANPESVKEE